VLRVEGGASSGVVVGARSPRWSHAPGQIGLWRESDRLALTSDCFYTLDMWGRDCPWLSTTTTPSPTRASLRKLAAMEPAAAWPGHAKAVTGDVRGQLERAADAS